VSEALLTLSAVDTFYGKNHVLHSMSLTIAAGGVTVVLGRNGAGKTTTLRSIMGLVPPRFGRIKFRGTDITGLPPHRCFRFGLAYVPEGRQIFPFLTVEENLRVAESTRGEGAWGRERIFEYFPALLERRNQLGRSLSGGEQQMLAIARALIGSPKLLMLDEPSQGLAPKLVSELQSIMRGLKQEGVTILLVEQNAKMALATSDSVIVLSKGEVVFVGLTAEFHAHNEELKQRFLAV
jgi:branched-chain amino acid transport system ATP-binding protein